MILLHEDTFTCRIQLGEVCPKLACLVLAGVAKATAALVQAGLVKLCADTSENVAVCRKRMDVASALNIELDRIGRADAAAAVSSKLCTTGR